METGERAEALEQRAILLQQKADLESALREKAKKHATDSEQRKRLENEAHNMKVLIVSFIYKNHHLKSYKNC